MADSIFKDKTLLITGGTGSSGIRCSSISCPPTSARSASSPAMRRSRTICATSCRPTTAVCRKVKFYIGDVRNPQSIRDAMPGVNYIFHAAALKQVPSCEFFPMQAVQTNIIGTDNVLHAAIDAGVERVVCLSTDKAATPSTPMGISKAMMEHVIYATPVWLLSAAARPSVAPVTATLCAAGVLSFLCSLTRLKTATPSPSPTLT